METMGTGINYFPFRQHRENNGDGDHLFRWSWGSPFSRTIGRRKLKSKAINDPRPH